MVFRATQGRQESQGGSVISESALSPAEGSGEVLFLRPETIFLPAFLPPSTCSSPSSLGSRPSGITVTVQVSLLAHHDVTTRPTPTQPDITQLCLISWEVRTYGLMSGDGLAQTIGGDKYKILINDEANEISVGEAEGRERGEALAFSGN